MKNGSILAEHGKWNNIFILAVEHLIIKQSSLIKKWNTRQNTYDKIVEGSICLKDSNYNNVVSIVYIPYS